ncbi:MAG: undecaprenyl-phosphate galactose phosphotransferase WbaP [Thermodesulfovibrionales bacterium]|nr:undecaprenyl-phosphate galactose phosphotransferase WbaP [Thermodesulfovibrionales bacterium]
MNGMIQKLLRVSSLMLIDLLAFYTSLSLAWELRADVLPAFFSHLPPFHFSYADFASLWWIPATFILFIFYEDLYDNNLPFWDETRDIAKSVSLASITLMAIVTLGKMGDVVSRIVLLGLWFSSLFFLPLFRFWGKKILYKTGIRREKILILGAGNAGRLVIEGLLKEKHIGYDVVGFLDDDEQKRGTVILGRKVFGRVSDFRKVMEEQQVKTVIIAIPSLPPEQLSTLTAKVQNSAVNTMIIPALKGIAILNTDLTHLFSEELFLMNIRNNLKSAANRLIKRLFDISLCVVSLPLLLPVTAIIGLIIRLETPGQALYSHDRIGRNGRIFRCYKFRTMHRDAEEKLKELLDRNEEIRVEWEHTWKLKDDPRITKVGRFLRTTSLDELPQIFNVLKGEMSLVGPRPYLPREKEDLQENMQVICSAKPGITGLWQVSGRSNTSYKHRLKLDAWYVMNWSLWLDIVILFKTVKVVLKAEGAY